MSWFPVHADIVTHSDFKKCSPAEKLFFLYVTSEFNVRGKFYMSDLRAGITLGISEETAKKARRKFRNMGMIEITPGFRMADGRGVATTYKFVKGAKVQEGKQFIQQHRHTFNSVLHKVRLGILEPIDAVVYVYLNYVRQKHNPFGVSKRWFKELTGFQNAFSAVKRLYNGYVFDDESRQDKEIRDETTKGAMSSYVEDFGKAYNSSRLFKLVDFYHQFAFDEWCEELDPIQSAVMAKRAMEFEQYVEQKLNEHQTSKQDNKVIHLPID